MGLYRDDNGRLVELDDKFADARGYVPASPAEQGADISTAADAARGEERGALGAINAGLTNFESGLTLGLSDVALGETLTPLERQRVLAEMDAHPYLSTGGKIAGATVGAFAAPGTAAARTPTGYLSALAQQQVEAGLERGGIAGTAKALGAMGTEGAIQSGADYIGRSALEDKETTVEGLAGALGNGFEFGAGGGAAALGVVKGTVAARRMFSRVMDGQKGAKAAESAWTQAAQESLDADQATARAAEVKLDEIRKAKIEAQRYRNEAKAATAEERIRASQVEKPVTESDFEASVPTDVIPKEQAPGGMPTSVFKRPAPAEGPEPLIDVTGQPQGEATSVFKPTPTEVIKSTKLPAKAGPPGETQVAQTSSAKTALEEQLAGTKAKLDEGTALKDIPGENAKPGSPVSPQIPPGKKPPETPGRNPSRSIEDWLGEKAAFDNSELSQAKKIEDLKGAAELRTRRQETLSEIRYKATEELLGPKIAKEEQRLQDVMDKYNDARKAVEEIMSRGEPGGPAWAGEGARTGDEMVDASAQAQKTMGGRGQRQAIEILDDAHEEALLRAKHAADPEEASRALNEADELEHLLEGLATPEVSKGVSIPRNELRRMASRHFPDELAGDVAAIKRYEEASAELSDALGDQAHPISAERAKGWRDAEREGERKMYDRTARAVDDAAEYGPEYKSPKERVGYARSRQNEAQAKLDEMKVQHEEATNDLAAARKKVREGERAKKAALREDAKNARAINAGGKLGGVQDFGGLLEILDVPGMPKPSDLPVVGPLLGAYLKFRTLKKAMGRAMGRVPATADARVASLASQTRDRIARAIDRSLGVMERSAKAGVRVVPPAAGILANRIYDDGGENPPKDAPIQKLAAARMREISAYVSTPGAIEKDVRIQLQGVTDPDIIAAAEAHRRAAMEYLRANMPPIPEQGLLNNIEWQPSPAESMAFARRLDAIGDPAGVYERLAQQQAMISLEAADALRAVYPSLFSQAQQRVLERAQEGGLKVPYRTRIQMSLLYKLPLDSALDPVNFQITQSVYERKPASPAYNPAAPTANANTPPTAQPAIANPVNISEAYNTSFDRR